MFGVPTCDHCVQWGKADSLSYVAELLNIEPSTRTGAGPMLPNVVTEHISYSGFIQSQLLTIGTGVLMWLLLILRMGEKK